jgi:hypothetical protein
MEILTQYLIENGGIAGLVAVTALLGVGLLVRMKGLPIFGPSKPTFTESDVGKSLSAVSRRLDRIEADLEQRPTREDLFSLKLSLTTQNEQLKSLIARTEATGHAVNRMEQYMIDYAMKGKS